MVSSAISQPLKIDVMISVMTKILPSPDWFIGLDSLDLCSQGAFRQAVNIQVRVYCVNCQCVH